MGAHIGASRGKRQSGESAHGSRLLPLFEPGASQRGRVDGRRRAPQGITIGESAAGLGAAGDAHELAGPHRGDDGGIYAPVACPHIGAAAACERKPPRADAKCRARTLGKLVAETNMDLPANISPRPVAYRCKRSPGRCFPTARQGLRYGEAAPLRRISKRAPALENTQHIARGHARRQGKRRHQYHPPDKPSAHRAINARSTAYGKATEIRMHAFYGSSLAPSRNFDKERGSHQRMRESDSINRVKKRNSAG